MTMIYLLIGICLMIFLIIRTVYGFIAQAIARGRNLKAAGFGWGFFLGLLGIIIMRCCPKE